MKPKFRAFWLKEKIMTNIDAIYFLEGGIKVENGCCYSEFAEDGNVVLMQSTGIKDKNGVEIYEGDILKLHAIFLSPNDKIGYLEYYPKYGYSIIFEGNRLYRQKYWASTNKLKYEVIGNIHENLELLGVKE